LQADRKKWVKGGKKRRAKGEEENKNIALLVSLKDDKK